MAKKVLLRDWNNDEVLPITRGELVLDSSGKEAFRSTEFLATTSQPGLMSAEDKFKIDNIENSGGGGNGKVSQVTTTTNDVYRLLFSETADDETRIEGTQKSAKLTFNPSTGVLSTSVLVGNLDGTYVNKLTGYSKATLISDITSEDTLISALGKVELRAEVAYNLIQGAYDGDGTIENLTEILKVLEGISDTETIQAIIGKYLPLTGGTISKSSYVPLVIQNTSSDLSTIMFKGTSGELGYLGFNGVSNPMYMTVAGNSYTLLHSNNYSSYALPLSGGTLNSNSVETSLLFNTSTSNVSAGIIRNSANDYGFYLWNSNGGRLGIKDDGTPHYNGNTLIHAGNISQQNVGSASKLNDNTAYTAWGQTFFENGVPKNVSGGLIDVDYIRGNTSNGFYMGSRASGLGATDGGALIYTYGGPISLYTHGSSRMEILANGNALIGTTTDNGAKLQVNGTIDSVDSATFGGVLVSKDGRFRINTSNSVNSFGYLKATAYTSALNRAVLDIGSNYGGTSNIASESVDVTALSIYRGVVGVGRAYTYDELYANYNTNTKLYVDGCASISSTITASSFIKAGSSDSYVLLGAGGHKAESSLSVNYAANAGYASSSGNSDKLDGIDSTGFLRKITVANNSENDFNTFENMTLTGRGDPTTGASLKNAPWSGQGPAGGYGVLTYLWSGYGTQMAWGYNSNRIYIRPKYYNSGATWSSTWDSLALTSDLKNPTDYYWANVQISATSNSGTSPTFANATTTGLLTVSTGGSHCGIKAGNTYINSINSDLILQNNGAIRFGTDSWDYNEWAGLKYVHTSKTISLGLADGTHFTANSVQSGGTMQFPGIGTFRLNGTIHINPPSGSYVEGIRMHPSSAGWTALVFCGDDNTADSGTSAKTWGLFTNGGNFYINKNNSNGTTGYELCNVSGNWGIGTVSPENKLDVNGVQQIYQRGIDNTAFKNLLLLKQQNSVEDSDQSWTGSNPSFGIGFRRYWSSGSSPYGETTHAGIYATVSSAWKGGLVFRTKNNQTQGGTHDTTALRLRPDGHAIFGSSIETNGPIYTIQPASGRRHGIIGSYDPNRAAAIWSMGSSYQIAADGTTFGNLYGAAYAYFGSGYTFGAGYSGGHSFVWAQNGTIYASLGDYVWSRHGFIKNGSSNDYVLLGGGGHKLLTDFSMAHSHPYLPTAGGTMTGTITISTDSSISWVRNTDYATIRFQNTGDGDTNSYLDLQTGDNGNEYIRLSRNSGGTVYEMASFKSSGANITGSVTAGKFIANNASGPHFTGTSAAGNWAYLRLSNSSCLWDIATRSDSGSGGLWLSRYSGGDNGIFVSASSTPRVGINLSSPSDTLDVAGIIRSSANSRYLRVGPQNSSHAHYETNADTSHWFNKMVEVNGVMRPYSHNTFTCGGSSNRWSNVYSVAGNFSGDVSANRYTTGGNLYQGNGGLILNNSDIWGLNAIYTADLAEGGNEGYQFKRSNGNYDSVWAQDGELYFSPNGHPDSGYGNNYKVITSKNWPSHIATEGYVMRTWTIDASGLDQNTWYPVTFSLSSLHYTRIEVKETLSARSKPSWCTHGSGFHVRKVWYSVGYGWGTTSALSQRFIMCSEYNWASSDPVRGIGQLSNSSVEYVFVRGGGKYYVSTSHNVEPVLRTSTYTASSQSVSPTTSAPSGITAMWSDMYMYAPAFYQSSDIQLKTNVTSINDSKNIPQLKSFDWKSNGKHSYGLIAQELEDMGYSELVDSNGSHKTVNYSAALSLIVGKLQNKIAELEKEVEMLKNKKNYGLE